MNTKMMFLLSVAFIAGFLLGRCSAQSAPTLQIIVVQGTATPTPQPQAATPTRVVERQLTGDDRINVVKKQAAILYQTHGDRVDIKLYIPDAAMPVEPFVNVWRLETDKEVSVEPLPERFMFRASNLQPGRYEIVARIGVVDTDANLMIPVTKRIFFTIPTIQ